MILFYKILNRLNLLKYININARISIKNDSFNIPLINGLGLDNLNHQTSWIDHLLTHFKKQDRSLVILDVGVNIGQTLLSIKNLDPNCEYIGFEPNSNCVYYVNKLIKANNFNNTTIFPLAISDKIDTLDLYMNFDTDSTATTIEAFRPKHYKHGFKERVVSFDLDTIIKKCLRVKAIDILKIDIEGSELWALKGARESILLYNPVIICEVLDTHSTETLESHIENLKSLEAFLKDIDYKIYQIHRNEADTKVIEYRVIHAFEVKLWNADSVKLNDYVFIPNNDLLLMSDIT